MGTFEPFAFNTCHPEGHVSCHGNDTPRPDPVDAGPLQLNPTVCGCQCGCRCGCRCGVDGCDESGGDESDGAASWQGDTFEAYPDSASTDGEHSGEPESVRGLCNMMGVEARGHVLDMYCCFGGSPQRQTTGRTLEFLQSGFWPVECDYASAMPSDCMVVRSLERVASAESMANQYASGSEQSMPSSGILSIHSGTSGYVLLSIGAMHQEALGTGYHFSSPPLPLLPLPLEWHFPRLQT